MSLSKDQRAAIKKIETNPGPFFVTGPAGCGKTFLINNLRDKDPKCVVTATTGMAAQLIDGRTLHSFCSIHPTHGVIFSKKANQRVRDCSILVVDEISMASSNLLEQIFQRFEYAGHYPKLVVVGDFLQLPPVEGEFAYESALWKAFTKIKLTKIHRQSEKEFLEALSSLRIGKTSDALFNILKERRVPELPKDCTQLFSYRRVADDMNHKRLSELDGSLRRSEWDIISKRTKKTKVQVERPRFPSELYLKVGARIVMLNNDSNERWVNGSTGEVIDIRKGCVEVRLDGGGTYSVYKQEEKVHDADGKPAYVIAQYPMILAWALTIHKAQGMSLDRVGVDLSNHFERGMTYVAISRCRYKDGLFLKGDLSDIRIEKSALEICA